MADRVVVVPDNDRSRGNPVEGTRGREPVTINGRPFDPGWRPDPGGGGDATDTDPTVGIAPRTKRRDPVSRTLTIGAVGQILPIIYGRTQVGALVPYGIGVGATAYLQYDLAEGPIESVEEMGFGDSQALSFQGLGLVDGTDYSIALGTPDQGIDSLIAGSQVAGIWRWAFPSTASLFLKYNTQNEKFAQVDPKAFRCVVKGRKVCDHRADDTMAFANRVYSENPALCLLDFIRTKRFGVGVEDKYIDFDSFDEAADDCDTIIADAVGVAPPDPPTATISGAAGGFLENGKYQWAFTRVEASGIETTLSPESSTITITSSSGRVMLISDLDNSAETVTKRVYRRKRNLLDSAWGPWKRLTGPGTPSGGPDFDASLSTITDTRATSSLGGSPPDATAAVQFAIGIRFSQDEGVGDTINTMRACFTAALYYNNGKYGCVVDKDRTATGIQYDAGNITGVPVLRGKDPSESPDQIIGHFTNRALGFKADEVAWPPQIPAVAGARPDRVIEHVYFEGSTTYDQTLRCTKWMYARRSAGFTLEWTAHQIGARVLPMAVVNMSHGGVGLADREVTLSQVALSSREGWFLKGEPEIVRDTDYHPDGGTDPPTIDPPPPPPDPPTPSDDFVLQFGFEVAHVNPLPEQQMAIVVGANASAEAHCAYERPPFIGDILISSQNPSDFDDCFYNIRFGSDPDGFVVIPGDYLMFQIYAKESAASTMRFGFDIKFVGGPWLSDRDLVDALGNRVVDGDRSPYENRWYQVQASLEPYAYLTIERIVAHMEEDDAGTYTFAAKAIWIVNSGTGEVRKTFFNGFAFGLPSSAIYSVVSNPTSFSLELLEYGGTETLLVRTVTSGTTEAITSGDQVVINNSATGAMTFNLASISAVPTGKWYIFRNLHASNNLTIDPFSTENIDSSSTVTLTPGQSIEIIKASPTATAWTKIGS